MRCGRLRVFLALAALAPIGCGVTPLGGGRQPGSALPAASGGSTTR